MALLSLVGRQIQRLDMDQAFNPLSGSARFQGTGECFDSDNSYTLTTPGPAAGQVGNEGRTVSFPSSDLCYSRGVPRALPTTCLLRDVWPLSLRVLVEAQWADRVTQYSCPWPCPALHLRMCQCSLRVSLAVCFKFDPQTLEEPQPASFGEELVL